MMGSAELPKRVGSGKDYCPPPGPPGRMLTEHKQQIDWLLWGMLGVLFFGYILLHDLTGASLFMHNAYDSYSVQALAWLNGHTDVSGDYTWLELAEYDGQFYVSFPPVPSVIMLPFAALFGEYTPSNLVAALTALACVAFCYKCFVENGASRRSAMFWALFYVMGSNMLWMSTKGGVWFLAQGFNLAFCTAAIWAYQSRKDAAAMALAALAVGCRPFSVCLCVALLVLIWARKTRAEGMKKGTAHTLPTLIIPAAVAVSMLVYNYVRFDNPFEFGHNYLPEFVEAENGQFSLAYVGQNAYNLLLYPVTFDAALDLDLPPFDGFMFYVANPLFLVYIALLIRDAARKQFSFQNGVMLCAFAANFFLLLLHKTLGGWQFGARYTVDLLPYPLFTLLQDKAARPNTAELLLGAAAVLFNIYGVFYLIIIEGFV